MKRMIAASPHTRSGLTLPEVLVGLALTALVIAGAQLAWRSLARGSAETKRTADMQRKLKSLTREMEGDLKRAGFGLSGGEVFDVMKKDQVGFAYLDLVGTYCGAKDTVRVAYIAGGHSLTKRVACGGTPRPDKEIDIAPDSLKLSFAYLDANGSATGASANVRTVEFDLAILAAGSAPHAERTRSVKASVGIVNNL